MTYIIYTTEHLSEVFQKILDSPEISSRLRGFFSTLFRLNSFDETKGQVIAVLEEDAEAKEAFLLVSGQLAPTIEDDSNSTRLYDRGGDLI